MAKPFFAQPTPASPSIARAPLASVRPSPVADWLKEERDKREETRLFNTPQAQSERRLRGHQSMVKEWVENGMTREAAIARIDPYGRWEISDPASSLSDVHPFRGVADTTLKAPRTGQHSLLLDGLQGERTTTYSGFGWQRASSLKPSLETVLSEGKFALPFKDFRKMLGGKPVLAVVESTSWRSNRVMLHALSQRNLTHSSLKRLEGIARKTKSSLFSQSSSTAENVLASLRHGLTEEEATRWYDATRRASNWSRFTGLNSIGYSKELYLNHPAAQSVLRHEEVHSVHMAAQGHSFIEQELARGVATLEEATTGTLRKMHQLGRKFGPRMRGRFGASTNVTDWIGFKKVSTFEGKKTSAMYQQWANGYIVSTNPHEKSMGLQTMNMERLAWGNQFNLDWMDQAEQAGLKTPRTAQAGLLARRGMTEADLTVARQTMKAGDHAAVGTGLWSKTVRGSRRMPFGYMAAGGLALGAAAMIATQVHHRRAKKQDGERA